MFQAQSMRFCVLLATWVLANSALRSMLHGELYLSLSREAASLNRERISSPDDK